MRRLIAATALTVSAVAVATPAFAFSAAPKNPVEALKKQFVAGKGVKVSETTTMLTDGKPTGGVGRMTGVLAFGKKGVVASDLTRRTKGGPKVSDDDEFAALFSPTRYISVNGQTYAKGGLYGRDLPEGKKWVRVVGAPDATLSGSQLINIFDGSVLKTVLKGAKSVRGGVYKGAISLNDLSRASGGVKLPGKIGKVKVAYAITVNSKQLVTRVTSVAKLDFGLLGVMSMTADTRFSDWGSKVTITAPPEEEVVDAADLDTEVPELPSVLTEAAS
ncbi:hypothetical protein ACFXJ8_01420 [Nonomuraea sp. NPDC059194]|uniref:hypothetical protein n=1 Tax=Nonomuraea sp. NPDC059194 TaxID=3346764 RepID=UPI00369051CF